jgi:hypothetical protein
MAAFRGPKVWLWRWRRNPLRRPSDRLESWVVLAAWALAVLGGAAMGAMAKRSVEDDLDRQRVEWRPVVARLTEGAPGTAASSGSTAERVWAEARWTAGDGSAHTGRTRVPPATAVGTPVIVWTDAEGLMVTKPVTESEGRLRSSLIGALVGAAAAGVPFVGGRMVRGRLERRRVERWGEEWERVAPLWQRKTW